jgi:hypothetical protein
MKIQIIYQNQQSNKTLQTLHNQIIEFKNLNDHDLSALELVRSSFSSFAQVQSLQYDETGWKLLLS